MLENTDHKLKRKFILILSLLILLICFLQNIKASGNFYISKPLLITGTDDLLIDKLYHLKEVQDKLKYLRTLTNKSNISIIITNRPRKNNSKYIVEVGFENRVRFEVYYTFQIDKKCVKSPQFINHLKILDEDGNYILLIKWRHSHHELN